MYRSPLAQAAHQAILDYIRNRASLDKVITAINALDRDSILESSIHGHSHLIDILHLPFEIQTDNPAIKCANMMSALLEKAKKIGPDTLVILMLQPNHDGFTPLHGVLISGNPENMRIYFDEVRKVVQEKLIHKNDYLDLLLKPNQASFTPLHQAANSNSPEILETFLLELRSQLTDKQYESALNQRARGYLPSCQYNKSNARAINIRLTQERKHFVSYAEASSDHSAARPLNTHPMKRTRTSFFSGEPALPDIRPLRHRHFP